MTVYNAQSKWPYTEFPVVIAKDLHPVFTVGLEECALINTLLE